MVWMKKKEKRILNNMGCDKTAGFTEWKSYRETQPPW